MKNNVDIPPKLAKRLLGWFIKDRLAEEVVGDLEEKFFQTLENKSVVRAKLNYWYQVINYMRPFAIKLFKNKNSNYLTMFSHYFKISKRHLLKNNIYSLINVGGLALGMTVAMIIGLWVYDELSFNKNHDNYDSIAQVMRTGTLNGEYFTFPYLPYALGDELKTKYAESFKYIIMSSLPGNHILTYQDKIFDKTGLYMDKEAPEMLTLDMVAGSWNGLEDLHAIFISRSTALELFGPDYSINQTLKMDNDVELKVTGIFEDFPHNSRFHDTEFITSWDLYESSNSWVTSQGFTNNFLNIYVQLNKGIDPSDASERIKDALLINVQDNETYVKINPQLSLHPMSRWHLYGEWENGESTGGLIKFVWLFGIIGVFVLALACINFMNLSTARSEKRAKEIGIRKAIGSVRQQLIQQFFTESFLLVIMAFITSMFFLILSMNWFNQLAGKNMELPWQNEYFWILTLGFVLFTGLLAGSYPALYLSGFDPIKALKGKLMLRKGAAVPRRILVMLQFTVSVTMIISTFLVFRQIQYVKDRPVGYEQNNLLMMQMTTSEYYEKYETLRTELLNSGAVTEFALSLSPVNGVWSTNGGFEWEGMDPGWQQEDFATLDVSADYGKTVGWEFIQGRDFSKDLASDSSAMVISEASAELMGFDDPIGQEISWSFTGKKYKVIGLIKDMIMESPFSSPMPAIFTLGNRLNWINLKLNSDLGTQAALTKVEEVFKSVLPAVPFKYQFADQAYAYKFQAEERIGKLSALFAALAIGISCLGLFGLSSYVAEQRSKEICIRKILGASLVNLWRLLTVEFVTIVIIACGMATPIAYYVSNNWLEDYEYKITISWWVFVVASAGALAIALITVSFQAGKAALTNPVKNLRSE